MASMNPFEGEWKTPPVKLPEDKTYLQPAKAFVRTGCWTNEELEERYWNRRFEKDQYLSAREPVELMPRYTPIVQMFVDAQRSVMTRLMPKAYPKYIHKHKIHRLFVGLLAVYGTCFVIVNRVQYNMIPDRRFIYLRPGDHSKVEVPEVEPHEVNDYIEKTYLHRTKGHHH
ncbi:uncharacterized protein LOC134848029 [Symsagittifera roscoffensis]|uniref:uncharacterized protein LOC134848029 n=1 Tax=Symsagittifera roscoffensis TaxID=84072 RepID=UPI00307C6B93